MDMGLSTKIVKEILGKETREFVRITEGSVSEVYWFELDQRKYILKYLAAEQLHNELLFYHEAERIGVCVPRIFGSGSSNDLSYYVMEYIEGHNDPDTDTEAFFSLMVRGLKLLHSVYYQGFGRFPSVGEQPYQFEIASWREWIQHELTRLRNEFVALRVTSVLGLIEKLERVYESWVPLTGVSCLVHGDVGFGNLRYWNNKTYFIDPGWNRAMLPLWEVAYFDYKYFNHPTKSYRSDIFRKYYFPNGILESDEKEMAIYRVLCALETYRWYVKKGMDDSETRTRLARNENVFIDLFNLI